MCQKQLEDGNCFVVEVPVRSGSAGPEALQQLESDGRVQSIDGPECKAIHSSGGGAYL